MIMETVEIGVPVVITIDKDNPPPEWWGNFNKRDVTEPITAVERDITYIQKNSKFWVIFPNERKYLMFLLKWSS